MAQAGSLQLHNSPVRADGNGLGLGAHGSKQGQARKPKAAAAGGFQLKKRSLLEPAKQGGRHSCGSHSMDVDADLMYRRAWMANLKQPWRQGSRRTLIACSPPKVV